MRTRVATYERVFQRSLASLLAATKHVTNTAGAKASVHMIQYAVHGSSLCGKRVLFDDIKTPVRATYSAANPSISAFHRSTIASFRGSSLADDILI
jgi:hypothetical protein